MWEQYSGTIVTIGSIVLSLGLAFVAKKYANKYNDALNFIQIIKDALADSKVTKEELEQIIEHGSDLFLDKKDTPEG